MAKLLSDQTASELPSIMEEVRNMSQATRGRPIRRDRGIGGGGSSSRAYVKITGVTDPANYTGNVITGPNDSTVIEAGVTIKVDGATSNAFSAGDSDFADFSTDIYWIDGRVLG